MALPFDSDHSKVVTDRTLIRPRSGCRPKMRLYIYYPPLVAVGKHLRRLLR